LAVLVEHGMCQQLRASANIKKFHPETELPGRRQKRIEEIALVSGVTTPNLTEQ
jgi:hypothetical protein